MRLKETCRGAIAHNKKLTAAKVLLYTIVPTGRYPSILLDYSVYLIYAIFKLLLYMCAISEDLLSTSAIYRIK